MLIIMIYGPSWGTTHNKHRGETPAGEYSKLCFTRVQSQQIDLTVVCWNAGKVPLEMNQKTEEEAEEAEEEAEAEELYECPT